MTCEHCGAVIAFPAPPHDCRCAACARPVVQYRPDAPSSVPCCSIECAQRIDEDER